MDETPGAAPKQDKGAVSAHAGLILMASASRVMPSIGPIPGSCGPCAGRRRLPDSRFDIAFAREIEAVGYDRQGC